MEYSFTTSVLKNVNYENYEKDFEIVFANGVYKCSAFFAELASPNIAKERKMDPTMSSYKIDVKLKTTEKVFSKIEDLVKGLSIEITDNDVEGEFFRVLLELGNCEVLNTKPFKNINNNNAIALICMKKYYGAKYNDEIEYCAEHFEEMRLRFLVKAPTKLLARPMPCKDIAKPGKQSTLEKYALENSDLMKVLKSDKLCLKSEYSLLCFVKERMEIDPMGMEFLAAIKPQYLENDEMNELVGIIDKLEYPQIGQLWKHMKERLISLKVLTNAYRHRYCEIPYNGKNRWNGIFAYYRTKDRITDWKFNPAVEIKTKNNNNDIYRIIDGYDIYINEGRETYIEFKFRQNKVKINGYSLKSDVNQKHWLKSWRIIGSNDYVNWFVIDERRDQETLMSEGAEVTYTFDPLYEFRYIRFMQIDRSYQNDDNFSVNRLEFFGAIGKKHEQIIIPLQEEKWNGIFTYLTKEVFKSCASPNILSAGIIRTYCNRSGSGDVQTLVYEKNDFWTDNGSDSSFGIIFMRHNVILTGYSFKSNLSSNNFPISWKVEGVNDDTTHGQPKEEDWVEIHRVDNCHLLESYGAEASFSFENTKPFKFFRFRLTKYNKQYNFSFGVRKLELFGTLIEV